MHELVRAHRRKFCVDQIYLRFNKLFYSEPLSSIRVSLSSIHSPFIGNNLTWFGRFRWLFNVRYREWFLLFYWNFFLLMCDRRKIKLFDVKLMCHPSVICKFYMLYWCRVAVDACLSVSIFISQKVIKECQYPFIWYKMTIDANWLSTICWYRFHIQRHQGTLEKGINNTDNDLDP